MKKITGTYIKEEKMTIGCTFSYFYVYFFHISGYDKIIMDE
jgi:hypothetical protein